MNESDKQWMIRRQYLNRQMGLLTKWIISFDPQAKETMEGENNELV
jgi:hypothetical protein